jgi:hypothetical protein
LLLYVHYLFATVYLVHAGYAVVSARSGRIAWRKVIFAAVIVLLLTSPILWDATHPRRVSVESSCAKTPPLELFISSLLPPLLVGSFFAGVLVTALRPIGKIGLRSFRKTR